MLRHPDGTPFTYQEYGEFMPGQQGEVLGLPGFIPQETVRGLVDLSEGLGVRKAIYRFPDPLPNNHLLPHPIADVVRTVNRWDAVNTAILKRYAPDEPSEAYLLHQDPEIYGEHRLVFLSLSGLARLRIVGKDEEDSILCRPGDIFFAAPNMLHSITPPLNDDGIRHFLFLGYDSTLANVQGFENCV